MAVSFDHTGMTELGPTGHSCTQRDGIHLIESEFIFEVVDGKGRPALEAWSASSSAFVVIGRRSKSSHPFTSCRRPRQNGFDFST